MKKPLLEKDILFFGKVLVIKLLSLTAEFIGLLAKEVKVFSGGVGVDLHSGGVFTMAHEVHGGFFVQTILDTEAGIGMATRVRRELTIGI